MSSRVNDPSIKSWISYNADSDFPIQNIPFGIVKSKDGSHHAASIIGDQVIDIAALHELGFLDHIRLPGEVLRKPHLNDLISLGKVITNSLRERLSDIFNADVDYYDASESRQKFLMPVEDVTLVVPVRIGDYTDFYSSREHATNVGTMFRDPDNALLPNWLHLPVGYHGRASSIVISGTGVRRPNGQTMPDGADKPSFGPCKLMDFELEMAFVIGKSNELGHPVSIQEAEDHIFGMVLFNDWSARDIQKWEYVPLGPFGAKNFASTISPWIVTMEALEPFRVKGPEQDPEVLPYLQSNKAHNFELELFVEIETDKGSKHQVSHSNFKHMYWSMAQQLTHHSITGCNMQVGDMCASGTISGPTPDSYGSMLELSWKGTKPIEMSDGTQRKFLQDGDTVHLRGYGKKDGVKIGFGPCSGKVLPALEL